jgi:catechol 2,3-dioxygenase-like lactoylglutathione lyase family enzyme
MRVKLGHVGHFGLAVRNPDASAAWWQANFDLEEIFRFEDGIGLSNDNVTMVLSKGRPQPETIGHMSFHVADMKTLRRALTALRGNGVDLEDPGDEIGPEAPGSPHLGLWFHDPDGYRWELSVQNGGRSG